MTLPNIGVTMYHTYQAQGILQIIKSSLREEGPRFLMKGWLPAWLRLTYELSPETEQIAVTNFPRPHTVLTFVFMEQLRKLTQWKMPATEVTVTPAATSGALKAEAR